VTPPALSVVVPAWNEEHRLAAGLAGLERLRALLGDVEAVLVDDGSTDGTLALARATAPGWVRVLAEPHRGKGGALRAGVAVTRGARVLVADVDWSVAPEAVGSLLAVDADVVCAVREGVGARRVAEPLWRHLLGRAFNRLVQETVLSGHWDTQCGFKLLRGDVARELYAALTVEGWAYDVELLTLAHLRGCSVREVPVVWRYEADSRLRPLADGLAMLRDVRGVARRVRATPPR
jgi:dolichyl-phosphate beta-glucosyltransferase